MARLDPAIHLQKCPCEFRWMPGSNPGMTSAFVSTFRFQTRLRLLATRTAPEQDEIRVPQNRGRRECRALSRTRSLVCEMKNAYERSHHRQAGSNPAFPARMVLTVSFVLSPVIGLSCHCHLAETSAKLDASVEASGPHDFAVRDCTVRRSRNPRPSHPAPNVRDDRDTPLLWARDGRACKDDLPVGARGNIFDEGDGQRLTRSRSDLPVGQNVPGTATLRR